MAHAPLDPEVRARLNSGSYTPRDLGRLLDSQRSSSRADERAARGLRRPSTAASRAREAAAGTTTAAPDPAAAARDAANRDALAILRGTLDQYGLGDLAGWAWQQLTAGKSMNEVLLELRSHPRFKAEFPEIEARQKAGLAAISPAEIVEYRRRARQTFARYGLPPGFYDSKDDFSKFLINDISLAELQERVEGGFVAAMQAPAAVREEFSRLYGVGNSDGALAAFFIDPDKAEPIIKRQFTAAKIGGAAKIARFGNLSRAEAEDLASHGVSFDQATAGFGALGQAKELMNPLVGQEAAEDRIDRATQLGAVFKDDAEGKAKIEKQARKRTATFEGGGSFGASKSGYSGLGSASS